MLVLVAAAFESAGDEGFDAADIEGVFSAVDAEGFVPAGVTGFEFVTISDLATAVAGGFAVARTACFECAGEGFLI